MSRSLVAVLVLASVAALLAPASPAFAAATAADEATAQSLFEEAKRAAAAGNFEAAAAEFAESNRLVPSVGALLNQGDALEHADKLASSWGAFVAAGLLARAKSDTVREGEAERRAALLSPRLARLALVVPPAARVPGFTLHKDGTLVGEAQFGSLFPVDVGPHEIEATAPGHKTWATTMRIETDGAAASLEIQPLDKLPTPASAAAPEGSVQKTLGLVLVGVGAAGLVLGAVTLGVDGSKHASLLQQCPSGQCAGTLQPMLQGDVNSYHTLGIVSSTSLVAGGALAVTGVILALVAPSTKPQVEGVLPLVGPGYAGLTGRF